MSLRHLLTGLNPRIDMTPFSDKLFEDKPDPAKRPKGPAERIYEAYPKHVGRVAAIAAIRAELKSKVVSYQGLMAATEAYAESVRHITRGSDDWRLVPHPSTWYRQQRWLDREEDRPTHRQDTRTSQPNMPTDEQRARRHAKEAADEAAEKREQEAAEAYARTLSITERGFRTKCVFDATPAGLMHRRLQTNPAAMDRAIWRQWKQETDNGKD